MEAVKIKNGSKRYGRDGPPVLHNLNLSIQSGSIYALIGASGCGKTTLLSCIIGLKRLDSGHMRVLGQPPGSLHPKSIGYMPQETALHFLFNIREIFHFYGMIYGMSSEEISERSAFLLQFLHLPHPSTIIQSLSGGQLRRVSLAIAMIHQPRLLVLDEPTVGLDPVLRERIWSHLISISQEATQTILITTHYLSESAFAARIGVMRNGHLIAEDTPASILLQMGAESLEKAVLQLSREDQYTNGEDSDVGSELPAPAPAPPSKRPPMSLGHNVRIVLALMRRTLTIHKRAPMVVFTQLFLPLIQTILFNFIIGTEPKGLRIAVFSVDHNGSLFNYCENNFPQLYPSPPCFGGDGLEVVCRFFEEFEEKEVDWVWVSSEESAKGAVGRGDVLGYLEFPSNYSHHLKSRLIFHNYSNNRTIDGSTISLRLDMSNAIASSWLIDRMVQRFQDYVKRLVRGCGGDPRLVQLPLKYGSIYPEVEGGAGKSLVHFIQPSLTICTLFILVSITGVIHAIDKRLGTWDRNLVAGMRFRHFVASSFVLDSFVIFLQLGLLFFIMPQFFGMKMKGSWGCAVGLCYITSLAGVSYGTSVASYPILFPPTTGILIGSASKHEMEVIMALVVVNSFHLISSGGIWPLECIPKWFRNFCFLLPVTLPIDSLRAIMFRGWGLEQFEVLKGFLVGGLWVVITISGSAWLHRRRCKI